MNLTVLLIFTQSCMWRFICAILILLGRSQMELMYTSFLGNNSQYMPICAKTICSWVRKVLDIASIHVSPGNLWCAAEPAGFVTGISLVSILQVGDWARVSIPARQYFSIYITPTNCYLDCGQHAIMILKWAVTLVVSVKYLPI